MAHSSVEVRARKHEDLPVPALAPLTYNCKIYLYHIRFKFICAKYCGFFARNRMRESNYTRRNFFRNRVYENRALKPDSGEKLYTEELF